MRKIIKTLILVFILIFSLASCGEIEDVPITPGTQIGGDPNNNQNPDDNQNPDNTQNPDDNQNEDDLTGNVEFKVSLVYNKKVYIPEDEIINVIWADDYSQYSTSINEEGFAIKKLDGDFNVYLENPPTGYTYNPNIYTADNDNPVVVIELLKVGKTLSGSGTGLYNEYRLSTTGTYRANITSKTKKIYYEYIPKKSGVYVIESLVNIYEDTINPKLDIYQGHSQYKNFYKTIDSGGSYIKGGYTKNFRWEIALTDQELGGVYTFVVYATSKTGVFPVTVDFKISYEGEHFEESTISKTMVAKEANFRTPEFSKSDYTYYNSDGGFGSYYNGTTNGEGILDAKNFKYNEETGYYHVYDSKTNTFGPILCAAITRPCAYYDESLNMIESHGNKNLTVSNGTENYKQFIENQYAAACNSDGVCYVTQELKEFLQKFSVSQRLFFDGNGFVESTGVYAIEEDQWLFACGYYKEK